MGLFGKSEELFPFFAAIREIREDKILCFCYTGKKEEIHADDSIEEALTISEEQVGASLKSTER